MTSTSPSSPYRDVPRNDEFAREKIEIPYERAGGHLAVNFAERRQIRKICEDPITGQVTYQTDYRSFIPVPMTFRQTMDWVRYGRGLPKGLLKAAHARKTVEEWRENG